jgi:FkbM family methyltransferase
VGLTGPEQAGAEISFYNFRRYPTNSTFNLADKRREFEIFFEDRGRRINETLTASWPRLGRLLQRLVAGLPKGPMGWWVSRWLTGFEESKARLQTLDEMLLRERVTRVSLLKVDVEGLEFEVLRGLGAQTWPLVQQVVLETNNRDGQQTEIERLLRANGLNRIQVTPQATLDNGLESVVLLANRPASAA